MDPDYGCVVGPDGQTIPPRAIPREGGDMSGEFAVVLDETEDGDPITIGGVNFYCGSVRAAQGYARTINAAVAKRERAAAAKALREAADWFKDDDAKVVVNAEDKTTTVFVGEKVADILRTRADRIEKGEA